MKQNSREINFKGEERFSYYKMAEDLMPKGYHLMYLTIHGSTLYGTSTENSDIDLKGIYIPPIKDVILNKYPKHLSMLPEKGKDEKNKPGDVEITLYSLQEFLKMCYEGETICIDMLHSDDFNHCKIVGSDTWNYIVQNRSKFYTKNMKALLGYAKKQAAKYGSKGTRMGTIETILKLLEFYVEKDNPEDLSIAKLGMIKEQLPVGEFSYLKKGKDDKDYYRVLEADYQLSITLGEFQSLMQKKWESYGERARLAKENQGIDWKALSHAIRACYQLDEILATGNLIYPLCNAVELLSIKRGLYTFEEVSTQLDEAIDRVKIATEKSSYPEKVDVQFWDNFLLEIYLNG